MWRNLLAETEIIVRDSEPEALRNGPQVNVVESFLLMKEDLADDNRQRVQRELAT